MAEKNQNTKETPLGVKITAILFVIAVAVPLSSLLRLLILFSKPSILGGGISQAAQLIIYAIFLIIFILIILLARKLWKLKNWARKTTIVLSGLSVFEGISMLFSFVKIYTAAILFSLSFTSMIISIIIFAFIFIYLIFNKKVKEAFS